MLRIAASRGFSELTKNVIRSSHGHSTPSLKISCKSVQLFSLLILLTNKQRNKQINKYTKKSIENNTQSPMYRGRGKNIADIVDITDILS